jgi:hypothetical protein
VRSFATFVCAALLAVAACGSTGSGGATSLPSPEPPSATPTARASGGATPATSAEPSAAGSQAGLTLDQPWATASLIDVRTGEGFRIADLAAEGRVVFVETMAIWCTKCYQEQVEARLALAHLDPDRSAWVALDVESTESAEALARYSETNGFDFLYAIADADLSRALATEFGDVVLNPPSVNVIVIGSDGRVTHSRGHKTADELVAVALENGAASR